MTAIKLGIEELTPEIGGVMVRVRGKIKKKPAMKRVRKISGDEIYRSVILGRPSGNPPRAAGLPDRR